MLGDLDKTLKKLLTRDLGSSGNGASVSISFDIPVDGSIANKPAINLFLYDVRENLEKRSSNWLSERQANGTAIRKPPPVKVDCSYFITTWSNSVNSQEEHKLLGEVMKVLLRYRQLPEECLEGSLQGQELPVRAVGLRPNPSQSLGEFWQAMGGKPKATLNYTVTISVPIEGQEEEFPLVLENQAEIQFK